MKQTKKRAPKSKVPPPTDDENQSYYNVWDALCDTAGEATKMKLRSMLITALENHIKAHRWTKAIAAKRCGVPVARKAEFRGGKLMRFSTDELAEMLGSAGLELRIHTVKSTFGTHPSSR